MKNTTVAPAVQSPAPAYPDPATLPDEYGTRVTGDCMAPAIPHNALVYFDKREPVKAGDLAVFYIRPEIVQPGQHQAIVKRLVTNIPPWVTFPWREHPESTAHAIIIAEQDNPRPQYSMKCENLLAVHKCMGLLPKNRLARDTEAKAPKVPARRAARRRRVVQGAHV